MALPEDSSTFDASDMDAARGVLGNKTKMLIVRHLWMRGPTTGTGLLDALGIRQGTLSLAMRQLEAWGVVQADLPEAERHGRSVTYTLSRDRISHLIELERAFISPGAAAPGD